MKQILFSVLLLSALCCGCRESDPSAQGADSTSLHIAVLPIDDCQPILAAYDCGLLDSLEFGVQVDIFQAAMDIDTAVARGHAQIFFTDTVRLNRMIETGAVDKNKIAVLKQWPARYQLLTTDTTVVSLRQLREKTIAMTRFSATHRLFDLMQKQGNMTEGDCFCIQINDVDLRRRMLSQGLVDAAFLPHPQSDEALALGARRLVMNDSCEVFCLVYIGNERRQAEKILKIAGL